MPPPLPLLSHIQIAFLFHTLLEVPASLNFLLRPSEQLSSPAPQAHALIRQYAILLFSSNLIALVFAFREVDETSRRVAGALAVYHVAPLVRALGRIRNGEVNKRGRKKGSDGNGEGYGGALGGPWVHAAVHAGALGALVWGFVGM